MSNNNVRFQLYFASPSTLVSITPESTALSSVHVKCGLLIATVGVGEVRPPHFHPVSHASKKVYEQA